MSVWAGPGTSRSFRRSATFLYDAAGFLSSWLADLAADQTPEGIVPFFVPDITGGKVRPAAAWGDAAVVVPWVLYQRFGDTQILADQFDSMVAWVDLLERIAGERRLWDTGFQFGDWLDPAAPPDNPAGAADAGAHRGLGLLRPLCGDPWGDRAGARTRSSGDLLPITRRGGARGAFAREYVTPPGASSATRRQPTPWPSPLRSYPKPCSAATPQSGWSSWFGPRTTGSAPGSSARP